MGPFEPKIQMKVKVLMHNECVSSFHLNVKLKWFVMHETITDG